jgi:type IV pilus assembly protein PilA
MKRIQKGFTLIELMIVVAIIGILAAVAIPAYQDYVVKSKLTKVTSTLDPIKTALAMYFQENGGFPGISDQITYGKTGQPTAGSVWNSLGFSTYPTLPAELYGLYYTPTGMTTTGAQATSFALNMVMTNIKAGTINGQTVSISPTAGTIPASTTSDTFLQTTITGSSAIQWFYGCKATTASPMDAIVKRYFNNSGATLSC